MKILKKFTAVVMMLVMMLSIFAINVSAATITKIEIVKMPTKTTFYYSEDWNYGYWDFPEDSSKGTFVARDGIITFLHRGGMFSKYQDRGMLDMDGLVVKVTYSDGSSRNVTYKETVSGNAVSQNILASPAGGDYKIGQNTVEVYFSENTKVYASYKINIVDTVKGDVDGNKKVNSTDALMALQASVQIITLTSNQKIVADMDGNGNVNSVDALLILKKSVA